MSKQENIEFHLFFMDWIHFLKNTSNTNFQVCFVGVILHLNHKCSKITENGHRLFF
jgi:hypothetical protein